LGAVDLGGGEHGTEFVRWSNLLADCQQAPCPRGDFGSHNAISWRFLKRGAKLSLLIRLSRGSVQRSWWGFAMITDGFEWDDEKARINAIQHAGVTFEVARSVFDDIFAVSREDRRQDYGEERFIQIGMAGSRLLTVVYTLREDRIRIISARMSEPFERRWYHDEE
jgi:uncharacterized protein